MVSLTGRSFELFWVSLVILTGISFELLWVSLVILTGISLLARLASTLSVWAHISVFRLELVTSLANPHNPPYGDALECLSSLGLALLSFLSYRGYFPLIKFAR